MKRNLKFLVLVLSILISINLVSCSNNEIKNNDIKTDPSSNANILFSVNDRMFRDVYFEKEPKKVVAIYPSDVEIIDSLGLSEAIIGIGSYVDRPKKVMDKPVVSDGESLNFEDIIKLKPDVVFTQNLAFTHDQLNALTDNKINVVITKANTIEETYHTIELISKVMGESEKGEKIIEDMKSAFLEMGKDADKNKGKKIYFEVSPLEKELWAAGYDTYFDDLSDILGAENIFGDREGLFIVDEGEVISKDPDYIFTISLGDSDDVINEIKNRPGWENISAVKNNRIYNAKDPAIFDRPSPSLVVAGQEVRDLLNK